MDAKPQRSRMFHPVGNENVAPGFLSQTHTREKSINNGASTATGTAALKIAPRRTAFADVSNTAKSLSTFQEDVSAVRSRSTAFSQKEKTKYPARERVEADQELEDLLQGIPHLENANCGKEAVQRRPQQPPKSTSFIPTASLSSRLPVTAAYPKETAGVCDSREKHPKQTDSTRSAFEYNDITKIAQQVGGESTAKASLATASLPSHQPRQYKSHPQLRLEQPVLRRTQSKQFGTTQPFEALAPLDDLAEALYEDAVEHLPLDDQYSIYDSQAENPVPLVERTATAGAGASNAVQTAVTDGRKDRIAVTNMSEPEEYWDEEDEDEIYDDQAYTTAHSYRSRGDLTTGGVTTFLFPKVTSEVLNELEVAKLHVEETRSSYEMEEDAWDVSMVTEYGEEIFEYLRELEFKLLPNAHYMEIQTELQWSMRSVLMDWLIQVHNRFSLLPETLFLAVNYIDRFLSYKIVSLGKLQLVGATALMVAAKYEEINCPSLQEIIFMVDEGYSAAEITKAERFMLTMLGFELGWPGPMSFLRRISKADDYDLATRTLAKYFLEVTIMDERFVGTPCSFLAAGAHCLSRLILGKGNWTLGHIHYSGHTWSQLRPLLVLILDCCQIPKKHHRAVFEKYAHWRYKHYSLLVQEELEKGFTLPVHHPSAAHMLLNTRTSRARVPSVTDTADTSHHYNVLIPIEG